MTPQVIKYLAEQRQSSGLVALLEHCRELLSLSRSEMKNHYAVWDKCDKVYRGEIELTEADKKAASKGAPMRLAVPLTYQQVQTFTAFLYSVYTQRPYFYELSGVGIEDCGAAKIAQAAIERDLTYNKFKSEKMVEALTNVARFGLGVIKHSWVRETVPVIEQVPDPTYSPPVDPMTGQPIQGVQPPMVTQVRDVTKYLGNKIVNVSPYNFFPDPRLPLTRFAEGEFVGSLDEYARTQLEDMQIAGDVAGIDFVEAAKGDLDSRHLNFINTSPSSMLSGKGQDKAYVYVEEIQLVLNPSKWTLDDAGKVPLDKECNRNVKYLVWIANDQRIIRLEPLAYDHSEFTYDLAQFTPDDQEFINFGLADLVGPLQDTVNWFVNSRIKSVRQIINNKLVVDPSGIEFSDLQSGAPVIRLKKGYNGGGIDQYIKQLDLQDVTSGHLNDVNFLTDWAREASGITENLLGSFASGRRSATEARNVSNNAASRLLLTAHTIWDTMLQPLGRKLLSNLRQGLDEPTLINIYGQANSQRDQQALVAFKQVSKDQLVGNYDFLVFDGTQPGQRGFNAQVLQELVLAVAKDPRLIIALNYDPSAIIKEVLELRDVRNADRFQLSPERAQLYLQLVGQSGNPNNAGATGQPGGGAQQAGNGANPGNAPRR